MLALTISSPISEAPRAWRAASSADVPEPHGERSTSASAKTVTLRMRGAVRQAVRGGCRVAVDDDRAVDEAQRVVGGMGRRVVAAQGLRDGGAGPGERLDLLGHDAHAQLADVDDAVVGATEGQADAEAPGAPPAGPKSRTPRGRMSEPVGVQVGGHVQEAHLAHERARQRSPTST